MMKKKYTLLIVALMTIFVTKAADFNDGFFYYNIID